MLNKYKFITMEGEFAKLLYIKYVYQTNLLFYGTK